MLVPSLEEIALFSSIIRTWKESPLQAIAIEWCKRQISRVSFIASELQEASAKENLIISTEIEQMFAGKSHCTPEKTKSQWAVAFNGIHHDIMMWLFDLMSAITNRQDSDYEFCTTRLSITQDGHIDRIDTLIKILYDSKFIIQFKESFLFSFVEVTDVKILVMKVRMELRNKKIIPQNAQIRPGVTIHMIHQAVLKAYQMFRRPERRRPTAACPVRYRAALLDSDAVLALEAGRGIEALKRAVKQHTHENDLQKQLMNAAQYVLEQYREDEFEVELLYFFYQNLEDKNWLQLLEQYQFIFDVFSTSWRYSKLLPQIFRLYLNHKQGNSTFIKKIFWQAVHLLDKGRSHRHYAMAIVKNIWFSIPFQFKNDADFKESIIPSFFISTRDFGLLQFYMRTYDNKDQKIIIAHIFLNLAIKTDCNITSFIEEFEALPELGTNRENIKTLFSTQLIKSFLITNAFQWKALILCLDKLTKLICLNEEQLVSIKKELVCNREFIFECLYWSSSMDEEMNTFFLWLHNDEEDKLKQFITTITSENMLCRVYEAVLLRHHDSKVPSPLVNLFGLKTEEEVELRKLILSKPAVQHELIAYCIESDDDFGREYEREIYCLLDKLEGVAVLNTTLWTSFLLSESGQDSVWRIMLQSISCEDRPFLRQPLSSKLRQYVRFAKEVHYYGVDTLLFDILSEQGHPNSRDPKSVAFLTDALPWQISRGRKVVDCLYRCFLAILKGARFSSLSVNVGDLTEVSLSMARQVEIDIPVII